MTNAIKATIRDDNNARRIRRSGQIPAVIYGGKKGTTIHIQIEGGEPKPNVKHVITYTDAKKKEVSETVMVFSVQRYPIGDKVLHIDFLRVDDKTEVTIPVTVKFSGQNTSKAIKMEGATLGIAAARVKVRCALEKAPKLLEANIGSMKIGQTFFATDLPLPEGVSLAEKSVLALATINKPRGGVKEA